MIVTLESGTKAAIAGSGGVLSSACQQALLKAGASMLTPADQAQSDIFVTILALAPGASGSGWRLALDRAETVASSMNSRQGGRIIVVLSALAAVPMRRHRRFSQDMAAAMAGVRALAMAFGPKVLVNGVGLGVIEAPGLVCGDRAQLSHVPLARPGNLREAVAALLFFCDPLNTYTSGQLLCVDGGWTAGYARDF